MKPHSKAGVVHIENQSGNSDFSISLHPDNHGEQGLCDVCNEPYSSKSHLACMFKERNATAEPSELDAIFNPKGDKPL